MTNSIPVPPLSPRGVAVIAISSSLLAVCVITFALRIFAARERKHQPGLRWDLIWVATTIVFGLLGWGFELSSIRKGLGHQIGSLTLDQIVDSVHTALISLELYIVAGAAAKLSIVALLLTIQGVDAQKRKAFLMFLGGFQAIMNVVLVFLIAFECTPAAKLWMPWLAGTCRATKASQAFSYFQGAVSAVTDWTLGLWPLTMISSLRISKKSKVSFCLLLGVGCIPGIASVCRTIVTYRAVHSVNYTFTYPLIMAWTTVEIWLILILGSAPSLRPLFLKVFGLAKKDTYVRTASNVQPTIGTGTRRSASNAIHGRIDGIDIDGLDTVDGLDEYKGNLTVGCAAVLVEEPEPVAMKSEKEVV